MSCARAHQQISHQQCRSTRLSSIPQTTWARAQLFCRLQNLVQTPVLWLSTKKIYIYIQIFVLAVWSDHFGLILAVHFAIKETHSFHPSRSSFFSILSSLSLSPVYPAEELKIKEAFPLCKSLSWLLLLYFSPYFSISLSPSRVTCRRKRKEGNE